jgi:hypothetical protein
MPQMPDSTVTRMEHGFGGNLPCQARQGAEHLLDCFSRILSGAAIVASMEESFLGFPKPIHPNFSGKRGRLL